ncbi:MAG: poly-gamma-glutamate biosynthesis protein [Verrucomicrobia bacterium]|nr:MAG: poly-gamma-glutamate biosynthesis protein [Verrucomicrobiota bacterium]PYJ33680.1 MAG: poly-gamma-glutamate biosynthesis protein [Verrucomicrobiota bacterium]
MMRLFLCGDVMTGRGIDQALSHPVNPVLYEPYVRDAREYLQLAEKAHGSIPLPLSFDYIWGNALEELDRAEVDFRIVNLETAVTSAEAPWPGKAIHYRMHPQNIGCLSAAHISACALANNHLLDWGYDGLSETLQTLDSTGIARSGAGSDIEEAMQPAVLNATRKGRVLLFSFGSTTSGIPQDWNATSISPGVNLFDALSETTAAQICDQMRAHQQSGDLIVASIHWGSNWGYEIPCEQVVFAHRLIEEGVAIVHGHSSHHVKAIEVFRGRLILYGCGDFLTDYEGISGYETFRGDLALMYFVEVDSDSGELIAARLVPMQMRRFRLERASAADSKWLCDLLNKLGAKFNTRVNLQNDNSLVLECS